MKRIGWGAVLGCPMAPAWGKESTARGTLKPGSMNKAIERSSAWAGTAPAKFRVAWCIALALALPGCANDQAGEHRPVSLPSPEATPSHPYAGFWRDDGHCDEDFGLSIAPVRPNLYSVSFCGPGGCFEPGTYRPNTPIVGDPDYQVIDNNTLGIGTKDGTYQRYTRCET